MADTDSQQKPHFILERNGEAEPFSRPPRRIELIPLPTRDRVIQGGNLLSRLETLKPTFTEAKQAQRDAGFEDGFGLQVEFESFPDIQLAFESLPRERSGIELLNVRQTDQITSATVFVPDGKLEHFEKLVGDYLEEKRDSAGRHRDHQKLIDTIRDIRTATLDALWTDTPDVLPESDEEPFWWEVWLPVRGDRSAVIGQFKQMAQGAGFEVASGELQFPERTVLQVYGSAGQMKRSIMTLNSIAELRRAKDTADFFDSLLPEEQPAWIEDLLGRMTVSESGSGVPHVCLFDTGVANAHPLIALALADEDMHSIDPAWGVDDQSGHGTEMAGLALAGNLTDAISSNVLIDVNHRLESVKLLPEDGANGGDARHHGYLTVEAVARPEVGFPFRKRVFSMAVTARDNRDRGRPSAWSATIDALAADSEGRSESLRLFVVSAGNIEDLNAWANYPNSNASDAIHDPGQSWNALTVGAVTNLTDITEPDTDAYQPIAPEGGLSPFSTTSVTWQSQWPLKPDVVFEGGNAAKDTLGAVWLPSLSLLTTHSKPKERMFTTTNATSAASALASRMSAQLMVQYPTLWPESIRGLIVHSAEWTDAMKYMFLPANGAPSKADMGNLVRHCGYGIPKLSRAMWSVENSLTMVCEETLRPFKREGSRAPTFRDMNLHRLPWPLDELEALGSTPVELRVTLSYFIEPNPSERGFSRRYRYESHGLRFDVKRPSETDADFRARINAAARDEEEGSRNRGDDSGWMIGKQNRHKGSLHSDIWKGTAADLASRGVIGIYPTLGWWKMKPKLECYDRDVRYSLIVSIKVPEVEVELYTAIANQIAVPVMVEN